MSVTSELKQDKTEPDSGVSRPLSDLKPGQWGRVIKVGGEPALRRRLLDMGLTPGTNVLLRKIAPLGDPLEIFLRGYELSLRREDAGRILVAERDGESR